MIETIAYIMRKLGIIKDSKETTQFIKIELTKKRAEPELPKDLKVFCCNCGEKVRLQSNLRVFKYDCLTGEPLEWRAAVCCPSGQRTHYWSFANGYISYTKETAWRIHVEHRNESPIDASL